MQSARVIVIGAGISGISAAAKLLENGFRNVTLLEAEKRIGGRVFTTPFASNVVDLGAQWCHGEKDNKVFELVNQHGVLDVSDISYPNVNFISSEGKQLDDEKCGRCMALCLSILHDSEKDLENYKGSLGSYVLTKYQEALKTTEFADIDSVTSIGVLDYFHKFENSIEASDSWFDTSGNGYLQYWECEGHPLLNWKDKGYKTVIDFITKKRPDPSKSIDIESKTLLNKEVANITWLNPATNHLSVRCSDGSSFDADHVIVTTSLGVLKENYRTMFTPQLPSLKVNAIEGLSIGAVNKIFLEFEKPFWGKNWAGFSLLWTPKDSQEIRGTENEWLESIFGFYKVDYQPNILCGWISGPSARTMEQLDDATILKGCLYLFETFLGDKLPWTKPKNILPSRWYSNKHFRGSYSFRSLTTDLLKTSANDLAHPLYDSLGKPTLLFAGEATSEHYYSTVHGALEAGQREAERLTNFYLSRSINENLVEEPTNVPNHYDAIVLGAGMAGLGAGLVLKRENMSFVILEAQERAGGRVHTVEVGGLRVDAGAQWLHGRNNELFKFADKFDLIRPELSEEAEGDYIRDDGEKFDEFFVKKVDFKFGQILEECEEFVKHKNDGNFKFPESLESHVESKFKNILDELETEEEKKRARQLLDWHRKFQIIDNSCLKFNEISAKDWGNYSFNGESCQAHLNVKGGLNRIVDKLEETLKNQIKLNQNVELVYWKSEQYKERPNLITIVCDDGKIYTTNKLICTFSMGVLKQQHLKMFSPPLPIEHREVIDNVGYGTINKIFLSFDKKWWDDEWKGLQMIWSDELSDDSHWTKYISGFDVVYPDPPNTLLGWIGGKGAIEMEKLSDEEISTECVKLLRKFLKNQNIPNPSSFFCSRWNSNKFIQGAYSFTAKTTDHISDWEKVLQKPIEFQLPGKTKNTVLLAGEACHEFYFSTVHGAFLSGMEQAEKIVKIEENSKQSKTSTSKL